MARRVVMLVGALSGLIAGCGGVTPAQRPMSEQASDEGRGPGLEPERDRTPDPALAQLAAVTVHHDDYARAELYSWTTLDQLRQLRETRVLLRADPSTGGRASPFNQALVALAGQGTPAATLAQILLDDPALRRRRYAWPSPFATTMGLGKRRYGDSLIRIELDERAWIGRFEPGADPALSFVDMRGRAVSIEQVLGEPTRLAALYHLSTPPRSPIAYREYVVCSEAMVQSWSIATPQIRARVEAEIELLEQLARETFAWLPRAAAHESAALDWRRASALSSSTPLALWHASLAFDNARYHPGAGPLHAIAQTLRGYEDDGGPALVHDPRARASEGQR